MVISGHGKKKSLCLRSFLYDECSKSLSIFSTWIKVTATFLEFKSTLSLFFSLFRSLLPHFFAQVIFPGNAYPYRIRTVRTPWSPGFECTQNTHLMCRRIMMSPGTNRYMMLLLTGRYHPWSLQITLSGWENRPKGWVSVPEYLMTWGKHCPIFLLDFRQYITIIHH